VGYRDDGRKSFAEVQQLCCACRVYTSALQRDRTEHLASNVLDGLGHIAEVEVSSQRFHEADVVETVIEEVVVFSGGFGLRMRPRNRLSPWEVGIWRGS